jgi:hypothetical protein
LCASTAFFARYQLTFSNEARTEVSSCRNSLKDSVTT